MAGAARKPFSSTTRGKKWSYILEFSLPLPKRGGIKASIALADYLQKGLKAYGGTPAGGRVNSGYVARYLSFETLSWLHNGGKVIKIALKNRAEDPNFKPSVEGFTIRMFKTDGEREEVIK